MRMRERLHVHARVCALAGAHGLHMCMHVWARMSGRLRDGVSA